MTRPLTVAEMKAIAENADARRVAWMAANRLPGEDLRAVRDRYLAMRADERHAELVATLAIVRGKPTMKEDRVVIRPVLSPLRRWMASVRGRVEPLRALSPTENALDTSAAHLVRDR